MLPQALIGELVPPAERPRYQGYFAAVFTVSSVGGPVVGGFVVNHGDWRRERLGAAAALLSLTRSTGAALGTAAFGGLAFTLLNVQGGGEGATLHVDTLSPQQVTHAFHVVFAAVAA